MSVHTGSHTRRVPHSFPTRRSSDLDVRWQAKTAPMMAKDGRTRIGYQVIDRKSTRLNSSHTVISYAVFCLKKKTSAIDVPVHVDWDVEGDIVEGLDEPLNRREATDH